MVGRVACRLVVVVAAVVALAGVAVRGQQDACNPTTCPKGLTCNGTLSQLRNLLGTCGARNNAFHCPVNPAAFYEEREFCPNQYYKCGDGFCAFTRELCDTHGGVVLGSTLCGGRASTVCQTAVADGCDMSKAFCQEVVLPACVDFGHFRAYVDPEAGTAQAYWDIACIAVPIYNEVVVAPLVPGTCSPFDGFARDNPDGEPHVPLEAQLNIQVFAPDDPPCPDCALRPYIIPDIDCNQFKTPSRCREHPRTCTWTGLAEVACARTENFLDLSSKTSYCYVQPRSSRSECLRLPQCTWDDVLATCIARDPLETLSNVFRFNPVLLRFDDEDFQDGVFRDVSGKGHGARMFRMNDCNRIPGAHGSGAVQFTEWERLVVDNPFLPVVSQFGVGFFAWPAAAHEVDAVGDPAGGFSGQRFIMGAHRTVANATWPLAYLAVSVGTNGVSLYHYDPAAGTMAAALVWEGDLSGGWQPIMVAYVSNAPRLYVQGRLVASAPASPAPARPVAFYIDEYGGLPWGQYTGALDYVYPLDMQFALSWGNPILLQGLADGLGAVQLDLSCRLAYDAAGLVGTAGAAYRSPAPQARLTNSAEGEAVQLEGAVYSLGGGASGLLRIEPATGTLSVARLPANLSAIAFEAVISDPACSAVFTGTLTILAPVALALDPASAAAFRTATVDAPYSAPLALAVAGGSAPYLYAAEGLPPGVAVVGSSGQLTGAPAPGAEGRYNVSLVVTDANGGSARVPFDLVVAPQLALIGSSRTATRGGTVAEPAPLVQGGLLTGGGYEYRVVGGALPPGLAVDGATGRVSGSPRETGVFEYVLRVSDSNDAELNVQRRLTVNANLSVTVEGREPVVVITAGEEIGAGLAIEVSGGTPPYVVELVGLGGLRAVLDDGAGGQAEGASARRRRMTAANGSTTTTTTAATGTAAGSGSTTRYVLAGTLSATQPVVVMPLARVEDGGGASVEVVLADRFEVVEAAAASGSSGSFSDSWRLPVVLTALVLAAVMVLAAAKFRRDRNAHNLPYNFKNAKLTMKRNNGRARVIPGELRRKRFTLWNKLGEGNFGAVHKAIDDKDKSIVAIKQTKRGGLDQQVLLKEAFLHAQLSHPCVVALKGVVTRDQHCWMVLEYCEKGTLLELVRSHTVDFPTHLRLALDVCSGMRYLEDEGIVHCDLACRNVLLTDDYRCKISDLGLAHNIADGSDYYRGHSTDSVPYRWAAPEVNRNQIYSHGSDVWSFGITVYEMVSRGKKPFMGWSRAKIMKRQNEGYVLPLGDFSAYLDPIVLPCWKWDPEDRPSFAALAVNLEQLATRLHARNSLHDRTRRPADFSDFSVDSGGAAPASLQQAASLGPTEVRSDFGGSTPAHGGPAPLYSREGSLADSGNASNDSSTNSPPTRAPPLSGAPQYCHHPRALTDGLDTASESGISSAPTVYRRAHDDDDGDDDDAVGPDGEVVAYKAAGDWGHGCPDAAAGRPPSSGYSGGSRSNSTRSRAPAAPRFSEPVIHEYVALLEEEEEAEGADAGREGGAGGWGAPQAEDYITLESVVAAGDTGDGGYRGGSERYVHLGVGGVNAGAPASSPDLHQQRRPSDRYVQLTAAASGSSGPSVATAV